MRFHTHLNIFHENFLGVIIAQQTLNANAKKLHIFKHLEKISKFFFAFSIILRLSPIKFETLVPPTSVQYILNGNFMAGHIRAPTEDATSQTVAHKNISVLHYKHMYAHSLSSLKGQFLQIMSTHLNFIHICPCELADGLNCSAFNALLLRKSLSSCDNTLRIAINVSWGLKKATSMSLNLFLLP